MESQSIYDQTSRRGISSAFFKTTNMVYHHLKNYSSWKKRLICSQNNKTVEGIVGEERVKGKHLELYLSSQYLSIGIIKLFQKLEQICANNYNTLGLPSKKSNIFHFQCS